MKILIIANYKEGAGGISGQVKLLHDFLIQEGTSVSIFGTKTTWKNRIKLFQDLKRIGKEYDVFHIHCCSKIGFFPAILGIEVGKKLGKKIILTYHGGGADRFFHKFPWLVNHYLRRTNANIVLSGFTASIFDKYGLNYKVIPNILPYDESLYKVRTVIKPSFISVRTLKPLYNVECIVKAFKIVKESIPDATLKILSDGSCRQSLEKYVTQNNIDGVEFVGRVPNSKIYESLNKCDVFISMPKIDNQPMSILEAFKCGLLVISSNVGGVPYMIKDKYNGILVESDNHVQLAKDMISAVKNQSLSLELAHNGHESLVEYRWDNIKEKIFNLYH